MFTCIDSSFHWRDGGAKLIFHVQLWSAIRAVDTATALEPEIKRAVSSVPQGTQEPRHEACRVSVDVCQLFVGHSAMISFTLTLLGCLFGNTVTSSVVALLLLLLLSVCLFVVVVVIVVVVYCCCMS